MFVLALELGGLLLHPLGVFLEDARPFLFQSLAGFHLQLEELQCRLGGQGSHGFVVLELAQRFVAAALGLFPGRLVFLLGLVPVGHLVLCANQFLVLELALGNFLLSSHTGYQERELTSLSDVDETPAGQVYAEEIFQLLPVTPITVQGITGSREDRDEFSQDLRLDYVGDGGVFTSLEDMLAWDQNFYDNQLGQGGPFRTQ